MLSMRGVRPLIVVAILFIIITYVSEAHAPSYMLYYKDVGIVVPKEYDVSSISSFTALLKKYNLFKHDPKIIYEISHKDDIADIDILIFGIYPDHKLINKSSIEIIGSWFDQGGKLIVFFNPLDGDYPTMYRKYNILLDRLGSSVNIESSGYSFKIVSDGFILPKNNMREYSFEINGNTTCIYYVTGKYTVRLKPLFKGDIGNVHPLTYIENKDIEQALSVIELIYVYSDLFTKVYSKVFLCMGNPLMEEWYRYNNSQLFIEVLSWGVSPHTELNRNGLMMISTLIIIGLSPYLYIAYHNRRKRNQDEV